MIGTHPASQSAALGATATFSVAASSDSALRYQWNRNGAPIAGATGASYTTAKVSGNDSGTVYSVTVTNASGKTDSAPALLAISDSGPYLFAGSVNSDGLNGPAEERMRDGAGVMARFFAPHGVEVDSEGNVYGADGGNHALRKISPDGVVSTLAKGLGEGGVVPNKIVAGPGGILYVRISDPAFQSRSDDQLVRIDANGAVTPLTLPVDRSYQPAPNSGQTVAHKIWAMATDSQGNYYDLLNTSIENACSTPSSCVPGSAFWTVRTRLLDGTIRAVRLDGAGMPQMGLGITGMAADDAGNVYLSAPVNPTTGGEPDGVRIWKVTPTGAVSLLLDRINLPSYELVSIAADGSSVWAYRFDGGDYPVLVRKVSASGQVSELVSAAMPGLYLQRPMNVSVYRTYPAVRNGRVFAIWTCSCRFHALVRHARRRCSTEL